MIELIDTFIKPDSAEWYEYASPQGLADIKIIEAAIDNFISLSLGESRIKMYNGNTGTATIVLADWDTTLSSLLLPQAGHVSVIVLRGIVYRTLWLGVG